MIARVRSVIALTTSAGSMFPVSSVPSTSTGRAPTRGRASAVVPDAKVPRELPLEALDGRPEHEGAALHDLADRGVDLGPNRSVLRLQVDERDAHPNPP